MVVDDGIYHRRDVAAAEGENGRSDRCPPDAAGSRVTFEVVLEGVMDFDLERDVLVTPVDPDNP